MKFKIEKGQTTDVKVKMTNSRTKGSVLLEKSDKTTSSSLSGVFFKLQDNQHHTIIENLVTDQDGKLSVNDLKSGTYCFVETKAPSGYQLEDSFINFSLTDNNKTVELTVFNNLKKIEVPKKIVLSTRILLLPIFQKLV